MEFLFSYGTLQEEPVQLKLYGRILKGTKDVLEGFVFDWIIINDETFLATGAEQRQRTLISTGNKNDKVKGIAFHVSNKELKQTDIYEPANYKRKKVKLRSGLEAWVYMAGNDH
jgi:gamma-glutamylcyclotransferase (GGCT)/AIG2-like uncharacterized protein YtfP